MMLAYHYGDPAYWQDPDLDPRMIDTAIAVLKRIHKRKGDSGADE